MMASKRSAINCLSCAQVFTAFVLIYAARILHGYTNPADVAAINCLYAALGYPSLPGWVPNGGDPCTESWQGVLCNNTDISSIILIDANLGGELGDSLSSFSSIKEIQLSNNNIGGSIPSNLPVTLQTLFLSDNELSGSIPGSLSSLTQLSAMSLNGNQLTGEILDAFQGLIGLFNLDLSSNNLSGQLPPSLENLSSLTTLHLQNNQLFGTLDVLQDLTLKDLNIENNLFIGPIPVKLLTISNFKKDGNPFNSTTIAALPSATSSTTPPPPPPFSGPPSPPTPPFPWSPCCGKAPWEDADGPCDVPCDGPCEESKAKDAKKATNRVAWIATAGVVLSLGISVLTILNFKSGNSLSDKMKDALTLLERGLNIGSSIDSAIKTQSSDLDEIKTGLSDLGSQIRDQLSFCPYPGQIKDQLSFRPYPYPCPCPCPVHLC